MNSSKIFYHIFKRPALRSCYSSKVFRPAVYFLHARSYCTQKAEAEELVIKEKIQITRPVITKWKRPPFVKQFFFGKFDTELLAFPEILDNDLLQEVEKYVKHLNDLYVNKDIAERGRIPADLLQDMKDLGLFGRMIPAKYGGLDLTYTACTRLNEVIGLDWSIYSMLTAHEFFASQVILQFGTEEQKNKYLPLLASGKLIAAFCMSELESGSDLLSISTTSDLNPDDTFTLNGLKSWVSNGELADIYIVFAKTQNNVDPNQQDISVFLVERDAEGITTAPLEKSCLKGLNSCMVKFKEVNIPKHNLIGDMGRGFEIYLKALETFRFGMNSFTFGTLKFLLDSVTDKLINTERVERSLGDVQLVRGRLSRISCVLYAMESMAYFTAALLDSTENPDVSLENTILKIFNSEGTLYCLRELMELVGSTSLMKDQLLPTFYQDALGLLMFDSPNDVARLYIGLTGCKYVGAKKAEDIMKGRNRLFFPKDTLKSELRRARHFLGRIKFDQDLAGHMHPSLVEWGNTLEERIQKFQLAVEDVLVKHGKNVIETQIDPTKLANAAVQIYAQAAVLSRSSRSYCIGLKNAFEEINLAGAFCHESDNILYESINDIFIGSKFHVLPFQERPSSHAGMNCISKNYEGIHMMVGEQVIDCRGYFPEHPLKHNF